MRKPYSKLTIEEARKLQKQEYNIGILMNIHHYEGTYYLMPAAPESFVWDHPPLRHKKEPRTPMSIYVTSQN